jgi:hypothetical protein
MLDYLGEKVYPRNSKERYLEEMNRIQNPKSAEGREFKKQLFKERQKQIKITAKSQAQKSLGTGKLNIRQKAYLQAYKKQVKKDAMTQATEDIKLGKQGVIRSIGSRAERIEQQLVGINEVPMLRNLEFARMDILTPNDAMLTNVEKSVTDSFPD